jgi:hypothetical protein
MCEMSLALCEIFTIFDSEGDEVRAEVWAFALDDRPSSEVRAEGLCSATNCAEWANEVLLAELGVVQPYLVHGVVLPEVQVVTADGEASRRLGGFKRRVTTKMIQHGERP